jgi:hypothetical protein
MSLIGLDLNSSRARAVAGTRSQALSLLCLDGDQVELPLAVSLEEKHPRVGRPGVALTRLRPHQTCLDFLPFLGSTHVWSAGRHQLGADAALALVFGVMARALTRSTGMALVLPAYLEESQSLQVRKLAEAARLRPVGSVAAPLAAVLAATEDDPEGYSRTSELLLVVDADSHALTWSIVERESGQLHLRLCQPAPQLGRVQWLRRLLDGVAHRCVRQSRRDPRESAETEQALYDQIVHALEAPSANGLLQLRIQGQHWYHHLMLTPEDVAAFVAPLIRQALFEVETILATIEALGGLTGALVTASAASLPGLVPALQARLESLLRCNPVDEEADYGDLLMSAVNRREAVCVLSPDALAAAGHELAVRMHRGDVPPGHLESIPLLAAQTGPETDAGPARLSFRGQDHVLAGHSFMLGRDPACDMVFETELYPHVSARHCEIKYDRRNYTIFDRSRHGTLLNDRLIHQHAALHSGDWIRLGPHGPVLRFLGQAQGASSR